VTSEEDDKKQNTGIFSSKDMFVKLIVIIGIAGAGLIFLSSVMPKNDSGTSQAAVQSVSDYSDTDAYRDRLCEELGNMIAGMKGAGRTRIMLTMDGTVRNIYAADNDIRQSESSRRNSSDENTDKQNNERISYIKVRNKDGSEQAIKIGCQMPRVRGVLVVCEGGDNDEVCVRIKEAVAAALNISKTHICVSKLGS